MLTVPSRWSSETVRLGSITASIDPDILSRLVARVQRDYPDDFARAADVSAVLSS
jgi:hypothetical protein